MNATDDAVVAGWWQEFLTRGRLPAELELVQGRLIRSVHRGRLPSGSVHVKAMAFPRAKDRLRYLCRALPASHEAAMLRAVAAAGVACPEVVGNYTARRVGMPFRSLLVLRSLPVVVDQASPAERLRAEVAVVQRLLAAGVVHRDLHGGNFVRLADGTLAVLDLQSSSQVSPARAGSRAVRLAIAARMLRERQGLTDDDGLCLLRTAGLVRDEQEAAAVQQALVRERRHWLRTRVLRCLGESTEFRRRWRWNGCEHWSRGAVAAGGWHAHPQAAQAWLGQRWHQLAHGRAACFPGYFRKWWWLGGGGALYVPPACHDGRFDAEVQAAVAGSCDADRIVAGKDPKPS